MSYDLELTSDHAVPVGQDGFQTSVTVAAGSSVYYGTSQVSSSVNAGTLLLGSSLTVGSPPQTWLLSAGKSSVTVSPAASPGLGSQSDRERLLRLKSLPVLRETIPGAAQGFVIFASNQTLTSGTQVGASIPVLAGESYSHIAFKVGTTAATWGTNADGHWYAAVYDQNGNLVQQTADQGGSGLTASGFNRLSIPTISPTVDALYTAMIMVYVGTGGAPVAPTAASIAAVVAGGTFTGLPVETITANAGQTTGVAPATLGTTAQGASITWIALYT